jgi:hypothetical protein
MEPSVHCRLRPLAKLTSAQQLGFEIAPAARERPQLELYVGTPFPGMKPHRGACPSVACDILSVAIYGCGW